MGAGVSLSLPRNGFPVCHSLEISDPFAREIGLSQVPSLISVSLSRELVSLCERNSSVFSQEVLAVEADLGSGGSLTESEVPDLLILTTRFQSYQKRVLLSVTHSDIGELLLGAALSKAFSGVLIRESGAFAGTKNVAAGLLRPSRAGAALPRDVFARSVGAKITGAITVSGTVDNGVGFDDTSICFAAVAVFFAGAVISDLHGFVLQYSGLVGSEIGDRKSFSYFRRGVMGLEVPPIYIPGHASGVANVSTADAIVSSDGANLNGADLHGFGLPISYPNRFGDGVCPKSSVDLVTSRNVVQSTLANGTTGKASIYGFDPLVRSARHCSDVCGPR